MPQQSKPKMRAVHLALRRSLAAQTAHKRALDDAIVQSTLASIRELGVHGTNIAAYNPLPSEPGPSDFAAQLAAVAREVFLPISLDGGILAWATATAEAGTSKEGALGVAEPSGARYTSNVLRSCGLVVAPALAVDRRGMRLGKGKGYYDRALEDLDVPVAAVVYDEEVVDEVPHDAHDRTVDLVITPRGFFRV